MSKKTTELALDAVRIENGLLAGEYLNKISRLEALHQEAGDYATPKGMKLRDEIGRYWRIAQALWQEFEEHRHRTDIHPMQMTRETWLEPLFTQVFGFVDLNEVGTVFQGERTFPIGFAAVKNAAPLVFTSCQQELDSSHDLFGEEGRKRSPYGLVQEYLNSTDECLWGLVTNGLQLRLVRDNPSLTRPAFIEVDLERIFTEELYSDFVACWLLIHRSRFQPKAGEPVSSCILEQWKHQSSEEGERALGALRSGVTDALRQLGTGFVAHPENKLLREKLSTGELSRDDYFQQLLRLIYRCLFLFTTESRGLLHIPGTDDSIRELYRDGYSIEQIRDRALKRITNDRHSDLWQSMLVNFESLATGESVLGLPALGGMFASDQCPDLDKAQLENRYLLKAIRELAWFRNRKGLLTRINYRDMDTEELGSVYESLLELIPVVRQGSPWRFGFLGDEEAVTGSKGSARKLTGSYYTPDSLVQELIKSALLPVIADRLKAQPENPTEALLSIKVVDPACGSGHFLLAAARRIAAELAKYQSTSGQPTEQEYRHALREVVAHCIYGVDLNPLAVELCKTALWLEALEPGKPLGFLDAHIRCGNGLVGILDPTIMEEGIPQKAFTALTGDNKDTCKALAEYNKDAAKGMAIAQRMIGADLASWEQMPEEDLEQIEAKRKAWQAAQHSQEMEDARLKEDIFTAAFFSPKMDGMQDIAPTNKTLKQCASGEEIPVLVREHLSQLAAQHKFFHWPLAFPEVFGRASERQGFDVVLGNPPWEGVKLLEKEFFAPRSTDIANAKNAAARTRMINKLREGSEAEQALYSEFVREKQTAEAISSFARFSGRYPFNGQGNINLYALFAESMLGLISSSGRAGFIVPTGISTDNGTKDFFAEITSKGRLVSLYDFENREKIFPGIDSRIKFCLVTLGSNIEQAKLMFFAAQTEHLLNKDRSFTLSPEDFALINPNTQTCPVFRSRKDAELTKKLYQASPVLVKDGDKLRKEENPWGITVKTRLFHMSEDSGLFHTHEQLVSMGAEVDKLNHSCWVVEDKRFVPLYEGKMIHHYDHRWASYETNGVDSSDVNLIDKQDPKFTLRPRYWIDEWELLERSVNLPDQLVEKVRMQQAEDVARILLYWLCGYWLEIGEEEKANKMLAHLTPSAGQVDIFNAFHGVQNLQRQFRLTEDEFKLIEPGVGLWLHNKDAESILFFAKELIEKRKPSSFMGWRDVARSTDERTVIFSAIPFYTVNNKFQLMFAKSSPELKACLQANMISLPLDYASRQKIGGTSLSYFILKQLPVLPPEKYTQADIDYIVHRVLRLSFTAYDMEPFARALGYEGEPFKFNPEERHQLKAELDAYFAKLYGLSSDDMKYILDPANIMGADYPSETFRVLKSKEVREFDEYRTQSLILDAWDKLEQQELEQDVTAEPVMPDFVYPGDDPVQQAYCGLILSTVRQLSPVDKKVVNDIAGIVLDISHRETFLEDEEALPLPEALPARSAKYDFDRAITSLESQKLIRRSSGNNWASTDTQNNGTAIIPDGIEALIIQALKVNEAVEAFNQQTTTADSHDRKTRKSS
ncbi:Eco57I restriction-modification methylase domain-containing protein [Endozoicomonadaceae bacterium StTr2]